MREKLKRLSKRIYRTLFLSGYARLDYRVTDDGRIFLLEANPNSQIARDEDFADSAKHSGLDYESLLQKIITLGLSYRSGEIGRASCRERVEIPVDIQKKKRKNHYI